MKISIITVCYNSENTIEDTIKSVLNQDYDNYEYLIIDGKSTDNTLKIVRKYEKKFKGKLRIISEKDKGIYDAMNKGIKLATGDIIGLINSDDVLAAPNAFSLIINKFKNSNCDGVYSNLIIKDENLNSIVRVFNAGHGNYKLGWYPPHPTLYLKKDVYLKYGNYSLDYKIVSDYDFMVRIMKNNINLEYIDKYLVYMRSGGVSTDGLKGYYKSFCESLKALKNNGIVFPFFVNIIRIVKVLYQSLMGKHEKK